MMKHLLFICSFIPQLLLADNLQKKLNGEKEICFTENKGQITDQHYRPRRDIMFGGRTGQMAFHLRKNGISYQLSKVDSWKEKETKGGVVKLVDHSTVHRLDINWLGCNKNLKVISSGQLEGCSNFYLASLPEAILNVKSYREVTYQNIYNGIDLKWYQKDGNLKYDFLCRAGSDFKQIWLEVKGGKHLRLNANGDIEIATALGTIIEQAPLVEQNGKLLKAKWILIKNRIRISIEGLDPSLPYTIDPLVRSWGTYYGDTNDEICNASATDNAGNVFFAGLTGGGTGTVIATVGAYQTAYAGGLYDAFLCKFTNNGTRLWATYYGGSATDQANACAVDQNNNIYIAGQTQSTAGIASIGSHQTTYGGGANDGLIVKFNANGARVWATYYGGTGDDRIIGCSVDGNGNLYAGGATSTSTGNAIATAASHQSVYAGGTQNAFLAKFDSSGVRQWGTYYSGSGGSGANFCTTDPAGNVYIGGVTTSSMVTNEISTPGSHQPLYGGGAEDAFLVKFNGSGVRQWGTYYGGAQRDFGNAGCTDAQGNVYMAGYTLSGGGTVIATANGHQPVFGGGNTMNDAYLVKFNSSGVRQWATYYGDTTEETGRGCFTDTLGNVYLAGYTNSTGTVIATPGSFQSTYGGGNYDGFLAMFNSSGVRQEATYYGGTGYDRIWGVTVSKNKEVYCVGHTVNSTGTTIASPGSHQPLYSGSADAFFVKFCGVPDNPSDVTPAGNHTLCAIGTTTLFANGAGTINWYSTPSSTIVINSGTVFITPTLSAGVYTYYVEAVNCVPSQSRTAITVTVQVCTEVKANNIDKLISVYPNPVAQKLNFEFREEGFKQIEIYDLNGKLLLIFYTTSASYATDLENLKAGIYLLKIKTPSGLSTTKLMKQY
jgi:hypothetical protein